jgi:predicted Na+-dependent transporter
MRLRSPAAGSKRGRGRGRRKDDVAPRGRQLLSDYRELAIVAVAAAVGLTVQGPLAWVVRHQGIDVFLVILVFSTALTIEPHTLRALPAAWRRLSVALLVGITVLPALSWSVAHLVTAGHLRDGVTTIGLAPCEIASIATTAMAGGDVALAGGLLLGSTLLTVALAGPILAAEASGTALDPWHILVNLVCIVALPLGVGVTCRGTLPLPGRVIDAASSVSTLSVAALVALVASEVHFARAYGAVLGAVVAFVAVSAAVGLLVGRGGTPGASATSPSPPAWPPRHSAPMRRPPWASTGSPSSSGAPAPPGSCGPRAPPEALVPCAR